MMHIAGYGRISLRLNWIPNMNIDRPNIDRAMVSLFFEIKRNMPFELRDQIKSHLLMLGHN